MVYFIETNVILEIARGCAGDPQVARALTESSDWVRNQSYNNITYNSLSVQETYYCNKNYCNFNDNINEDKGLPYEIYGIPFPILILLNRFRFA